MNCSMYSGKLSVFLLCYCGCNLIVLLIFLVFIGARHNLFRPKRNCRKISKSPMKVDFSAHSQQMKMLKYDSIDLAAWCVFFLLHFYYVLQLNCILMKKQRREMNGKNGVRGEIKNKAIIFCIKFTIIFMAPFILGAMYMG